MLLTHPGRTTPVSLTEYQADDGYTGWRKALRHLSPDQVVEEVKASGLRGRGGAGFPTGAKWGFIPKIAGAKYVAVNADESEPGTFKDRELIEVEPHRVLEGVALCCYAIGAETAFIYIRGEYVEAADRLEAAIAEAEASRNSRTGLSGDVGQRPGPRLSRSGGVYLRRGDGVAGIARGTATDAAFAPAVSGCRGAVPPADGHQQRRDAGQCPVDHRSRQRLVQRHRHPPRNTGPKIFCLSGRVNRPGNYELPLGAVTIRELIEVYGHGVIGGRAVKGVLTAGVSAPILTPDKLDAKLDYDSVQAAGSMLGSASLIVLDETTCIVRAAALMEEFFRHESCGKCTPCREGTSWLFKILSRIEAGRGVEADLELLLSLSSEISGKVLCALGDFATSPVVATVKQYRDEYEQHIKEQRCPFEPW